MKTRMQWSYSLVVVSAVCCLMFAGRVSAEEDGTNDAPKSPAEVKRDPFWPVGYTPEYLKKVEQKEEQKKVELGGWKAAKKRVVINGVSSMEDEYYAVVNGVLKTVGDSVSVKLNDVVYTWAIDEIQETGSVKLRRVSAQ